MTEVIAAAAVYVDQVLELFENVTSAMRQHWLEVSGEGSFMDTILAFVHAVDWTVMLFIPPMACECFEMRLSFR